MQPSKLVAMVLVAMFMSLNAACENRPDSEADKAAGVTSQDVKQETKQAVDTTAISGTGKRGASKQTRIKDQ